MSDGLEPVLLVEADNRIRVVRVQFGAHTILERQKTPEGVYLPQDRTWRCTNGERSMGSVNPLTGLVGFRIFREVLAPVVEIPEKPLYDELFYKLH